MLRFSCIFVRIFRKSLFLFVLTTGLGFGGTENRFPDTTNAPAENPLNPRVQYVYQGEKSVGTAFAWSGLGTLAPIALGLSVAYITEDAAIPVVLILSGLAVGPSLGEFYAASPYQGILGIGLRAAGEFIFLYVAAQAAPGYGFGHPVALLGAATFFGSTAYSYYNGNASVKRYNAALMGQGEWGWSPFLIPGTDGSMRTGALAWLRF